MSSLLDLPRSVWYDLLQSWLTVKGLGRLCAASGSHHAKKQLQTFLSTKALVFTECIAIKSENSVILVEWLNNCGARVKDIVVNRSIPPHVAVPFFRRIGPSLKKFEFKKTPTMKKSALASTLSTAAVNCTGLKSLTLRNLADEAESVATFLLVTQDTVEALLLGDCGNEKIGGFLEKGSLPLRHLVIDNSLEDLELRNILRLSSKLTVLHLSNGNYPLAVAAAMTIASLRSLTLYNLNSSMLTSIYSGAFGVANSLHTMNLDEMHEITDDCIIRLVQSANQLHSLRICCSRLSNSSMGAIGERCGARLRRFEIVMYYSSRITDTGLGLIIKKCNNLECLSIRRWSQLSRINFAKDWKLVPQLRCFDASGDVVDAEFLHTLPATMPNLNYLALTISPATSLAVLSQTVKRFSNLITLWIVVDAAEGCRFLRDALRVLLPQVEVVLRNQQVDLWKGESGMTSPSHKVRVREGTVF
jgi:hypothetical protein